MAEDPQPQTLQQRIAMLNAAHIGRVPGEPPTPRPKPKLPPRRPDVPARAQSINNPPASVTISVPVVPNQPNGVNPSGMRPPPPKAKAAPPPPLPVRRPSESPALPPRRPSTLSERRDSQESTTSIVSGVSSIALSSVGDRSRSKSRESTYRIKAPAWDPSLQVQNQTKERGRQPVPTPAVKDKTGPIQQTNEAPKPSLPPRLPPRRPTDPVEKPVTDVTRPSALSFAMNKEPTPPPVPKTRPNAIQSESMPDLNGSAPPPVPLASRPDLSKIQATKPRPGASAPSATQCMLCRDFSGPDNHAARFPRQNLPQQHAIPWLAQQLTAPFPSLTDKARAIFIWLHYNIIYDVQNFFAGTIKPSTPASTISTGLAVCEGFAGLYATLATHAGLESMVVSGHGKGFGYDPIQPGQAVPPYEGNHAWNVVRIDNGEWKLIDPCWGAGHVQGAGMPYEQKFDPRHFTMTNTEFGVKHFPSDRSQFYLPNNAILSWEEYMSINANYWPNTIQPATVFSNATEEYGLGERTVLPASKKISPYQQPSRIRFQFSLVCPHWTLENHTKKGPPFVYILAVHGVDGRKDDFVPLEHVRGQNPGGGGDFWYADVDARELGAPGQSVTLFAVTSFGSRKGEQCRGLTVREFRDGRGRTAMGFQGLVGWELA